MRRARANLVAGILLVGAMVVFAIAGSVYTPRDPLEMNMALRVRPPRPGYPFGTDQYGRDLLSRLLRGASTVAKIALASTFLGLVVGVALGAWAGYRRGVVDDLLMRLVDGVHAFPALLVAIVLVSVMGPGLTSLAIAIGMSGIPVFARLARGCVLSLGQEDFVEAARAVGCTDRRILVRHILPNAAPTILVQASASLSSALLVEAALSYLGLGVQPPHPTWGRILGEAQTFMGVAPWLVVFPGLAIALSVLGFNLLGDGLRDLLDR